MLVTLRAQKVLEGHFWARLVHFWGNATWLRKNTNTTLEANTKNYPNCKLHQLTELLQDAVKTKP